MSVLDAAEFETKIELTHYMISESKHRPLSKRYCYCLFEQVYRRRLDHREKL